MSLLAAEPAPRGKVSKKDLEKTVITAALAGGLAALLPFLAPAAAVTVTVGVVLKAFGLGAAVGGISELVRRLNTNSADEFNTKEPDANVPK